MKRWVIVGLVFAVAMMCLASARAAKIDDPDHPLLQHYLDGIQFAMGDLEADTKPIPGPGGAGSDPFVRKGGQRAGRTGRAGK